LLYLLGPPPLIGTVALLVVVDELQRILGPRVLGIAAHQLLAQGRVVLDPEPGQVLGDLDRRWLGASRWSTSGTRPSPTLGARARPKKSCIRDASHGL